MGLDMYLEGRKFCHSSNRKRLEGFPIKEIVLELGYWRKHPNLHGAVVQTFADGIDECQDIELNSADLQNLKEMVLVGSLPPTTGFFFGQSSIDQSEQARDVQILDAALEWLLAPDPDHWKSVIYRASW
jgi:hypothetical protein